MRRILRKIATKDEKELGDLSTLADPEVVKALIGESIPQAGPCSGTNTSCLSLHSFPSYLFCACTAIRRRVADAWWMSQIVNKKKLWQFVSSPQLTTIKLKTRVLQTFVASR